jgi:hypothetical protein
MAPRIVRQRRDREGMAANVELPGDLVSKKALMQAGRAVSAQCWSKNDS